MMRQHPGDIGIERRAASSDQRVRSTEGRTVYAVSAVNGHYDLLSALLEAIVGDVAALAEGARPLLVFCGDYLGPVGESETMAALVWLSRQDAIETVILRGSRETALLDFLTDPNGRTGWVRSDADMPMLAYGVEPEDGSPGQTRDAIMDRMPASHLDLLRAMPARTNCGDHVFANGGVSAAGVSIPWVGGDGEAVTAMRLDGATVEFIEARRDVGRSKEVEPSVGARDAGDRSIPSMRGALSMFRPEF